MASEAAVPVATADETTAETDQSNRSPPSAQSARSSSESTRSTDGAADDNNFNEPDSDMLDADDKHKPLDSSYLGENTPTKRSSTSGAL